MEVLRAITAFTLVSSSLSFTKAPPNPSRTLSVLGETHSLPTWSPFALKSLTRTKQHSLLRHQSNNNNNNNSSTDANTKTKKVQGVYARPSAAIERGSGFFVPGLEGSRVRILFGILVLMLNYVNHYFASPDVVETVGALALSEKVASFYGVLLLAQGLIESAKEMGLGLAEGGGIVQSGSGDVISKKSSSTSGRGLNQMISATLKSGEKSIDASVMSWVAATYVALTPATHILLLEISNNATGVGEILYSLGDFSCLDQTTDDEMQEGIIAAMDTVHQSKGGRVSIPTSHPASRFLVPQENSRCVLLQRIDCEGGKDGKLCLFAASDQLLAAFTKNDLKWLGSLGNYITV